MRISEIIQPLFEAEGENRLAKMVSSVKSDSFKYIILDGKDGKGIVIVRNLKNRFFGIQIDVNDVGTKVIKDLKFKSLGEVSSKVKEYEAEGFIKLERTSEIGRFMLNFMRNINQMVSGLGGNKVRLITIPAVFFIASLFKQLQIILMPHMGGEAISRIYDQNRELYIKRSGVWLEVINDIE